MQRPIVLVDAPSNLGLRPLRSGHVPGTSHAPEALARVGLDAALAPSRKVGLPRPAYETEAQPGTRLRNGQSIRAFSLMLADAVSAAVGAGEFPVVVGGDCSILLGALAGGLGHSRWSMSMATAIFAIRAITIPPPRSARSPAWTWRWRPDAARHC